MQAKSEWFTVDYSVLPNSLPPRSEPTLCHPRRLRSLPRSKAHAKVCPVDCLLVAAKPLPSAPAPRTKPIHRAVSSTVNNGQADTQHAFHLPVDRRQSKACGDDTEQRYCSDNIVSVIEIRVVLKFHVCVTGSGCLTFP